MRAQPSGQLFICKKSRWLFFSSSVVVRKVFHKQPLSEKCPNTELFLSLFFFIRTEYRKIQTRNNFLFGLVSRSELSDEVE